MEIKKRQDTIETLGVNVIRFFVVVIAGLMVLQTRSSSTSDRRSPGWESPASQSAWARNRSCATTSTAP